MEMNDTALRDPAYTEFDPHTLDNLRDVLAAAVNRFAMIISTRENAYRAAGQESPGHVALSGDYQLAVLHSLRQFDRTVQELAAVAAKLAGNQGAGYPQLGAAWGITRQSARTKWPDAVHGRKHETIPLTYAGGNAAIHHAPEMEAWWYIASGADGQYEESDPIHQTSTDAAAAATAFLISHAAAPGESR